MLTETGTTPRELLNAERWAQELRDEFALNLGHDCPFDVVPSLDQYGAERVTVAGVVLTAEKRGWWPVRVREYVASKLASPRHASTLEWFEWPFELAGFIGYMHAEHYTSDPDGFQRWLNEFRHGPAKWTVEYIASKAS